MAPTDREPSSPSGAPLPPRSSDRPEKRSDRPEKRSDQAPGEEVVQVNDAYAGGGPPPDEEPSRGDEQHPTGG